MAKIFKKPRTTTIVFYIVVLVVIIAFYLFMSSLMGKLSVHLKKYQTSHIDTQYRLQFDNRFADPDWGALYDEAGMQDTAFEGKQAYIDYMEAKVGDQKLICFLESGGINSIRCPVYLGDEEIGTFYMASQSKAQTGKDPWYYKIPFAKSLVNKLSIQSWECTGLTLVEPQRQLSVTVTTEGDRIVYLNGVALTNEQLVSTTATKVEEYLPEGVHGMRRQSFTQDGFLVKPVVTVTDLSGNPIEVVETTPGHYTEVFALQHTEAELEAFAISAAKTYCRYMIRDTSRASVADYFDTSSQIYRNFISIDPWMQDYIGCRFAEPLISGFYRYNEEIVTVRITMSMFVKRPDGSEKEYPLDTTLFIRQTGPGKYQVYDMNNIDIQQSATQVRMRFFVDGQVVENVMVDATASQLQLPQVEVPEGKRFTGWYQASVDADGKQTLSLVFMPAEGENTVYIPDSTALTPMDLQARFE